MWSDPSEMAAIFKWLMRGIVLLLVLVIGGLGLGYYLASHSLPDYDSAHDVRGLGAPLEIVRDSHAVPHIFGADDRDVFFGLGYAHAQDRLWQMTMMRRTVQGRLSELFGEDTVHIDELMRALDLYPLATRTAARQSDRVISELQAYADGVNAYIAVIQEEARGRGAPEFFLFSNQIAPWTPADSIGIVKLMALQLSDKARTEVLRRNLMKRITPEEVFDLLPNPPEATIALPEYAQILDAPAHFATRVQHPLDPVAPVGLAGASNAWAAQAARSASGASLLAADPHLGLSAPSIWYLARLELQSGGVIGGTIPGMPGVLVGRNPTLGWGLTSSYLDDQDIYIEKINPDNPDEYLTPDGYVPFQTRDSVITIKDAAPRTMRLRWTRHGPVLPEGHFGGVGDVTPEGHVASLAWTALDEDDRTIEAMLDIMRAGSVREARQITRLFVAPSNNLTLADRTTIAMQAMGRVPKRRESHKTLGLWPSAGWLAENDWDGYLPFETNPFVMNPDSGIVANTNNKISDAPFPEHFSFDWGDTVRITRATRLLNGRQFHTLDSFIEAQTDTVSPAARSILSVIGKELWYTGEAIPADTVEGRRQQALALLGDWNGEMSEHDPEPLIYAAWSRALQRRIIEDEIGPLASRLSRPRPLFLENVFRNVDGAAKWCDIKLSSKVETCEDMARLALDEAIIELTEAYGTRMEGWRWGTAHQALHKHSVLGDVPVVQWIMNIRQDTPGGNHTLLRGATSGGGENPYLNVHGSGFRGVYDFADPDASVYIISTGQSGHFLSKHYDDLSLLWRRSEYIPMSLDPALARGGAVGITTLTPVE